MGILNWQTQWKIDSEYLFFYYSIESGQNNVSQNFDAVSSKILVY